MFLGSKYLLRRYSDGMFQAAQIPSGVHQVVSTLAALNTRLLRLPVLPQRGFVVGMRHDGGGVQFPGFVFATA